MEIARIATRGESLRFVVRWTERQISVRIVKMLRILQVNLENVTFWGVQLNIHDVEIKYIVDPSKISVR